METTNKRKFRTPDEYEPPLDPGIADAVRILQEGGIETFESCEGGQGHSYLEPAVRFNGEVSDGFKALAIAIQGGLQVHALRRVWRMEDGEPVGPWWELVLKPATVLPG